MSKQELKELIYDLENILKLDKRFKKNKDNKYKKIIKNIFIESNKYSLINLARINTPIIYNNQINNIPTETCNCLDKIKYIKTQSKEKECSDDYDFLLKVYKNLDELNELAKL
jgi:hypothetical protein